jgi:hypothetical protein
LAFEQFYAFVEAPAPTMGAYGAGCRTPEEPEPVVELKTATKTAKKPTSAEFTQPSCLQFCSCYIPLLQKQ